MAWLARNYDQVLRAAWEHVVLTGLSVGIALGIALVVGVIAARRPGVYRIAITATGVFYTIPSLALFAILIPIVGLGRTPAVIGLVGYSLLALIRNTVAGLQGVPGDVLEAASGMGLGPRQRLWRVELPLALPVILAGVRVVTVTVIGIATVAAYVNAGGLGALIFTGLAQNNGAKVAAGAFFASAFAVGADWTLGWLQRRVAARARA
ncbi:MAG: ABC transporter permease [Armatimonadota bacterium]|nr:ABC transporter permease [Armatimonadota bacterium]MDR7531867.1 ABC transporter permease [Armatimonadota bacterium]MDR7534788.1 ABC transporter permease [Armatimonadota bacterium]